MRADLALPPHLENGVRKREEGEDHLIPHLTSIGVRGEVRKIPEVCRSRGEVRISGPVVAIDIGRTGALALFVAGDLTDIADMPVLADGPAGRPTINGPMLAALIRRWAPTEAVCEHVAARPGESPSGAFAFGRSRGVIEGVLADQAVPVRFVTPGWWKRRAGIPPGDGMKDLARSTAIARWPGRADLFARKLDHDRAEAALIGLAYIREKIR